MVKTFCAAYVVPDRLVCFLLEGEKLVDWVPFIPSYSKSAAMSSFKVLNQIPAWSSSVSPNAVTLVVSVRGSYARHISLNLSTWSYASLKPRKRGTSLEIEALFPPSFVGFLEISVGSRSFSISATRSGWIVVRVRVRNLGVLR